MLSLLPGFLGLYSSIIRITLESFKHRTNNFETSPVSLNKSKQLENKCKCSHNNVFYFKTIKVKSKVNKELHDGKNQPKKCEKCKTVSASLTMYLMAERIWAKAILLVVSDSFPSLQILLWRSPPPAYSSTRWRRLGVSTTSYRRTTLGCRRNSMLLISLESRRWA